MKKPHRYKKECHKQGNNQVFPIGNRKIMYGGSQFEGADPLPGMLFIDLLNRGQNDQISTNYQTKYLDQYLIKIISIPWPDMSLPEVPDDFWVALAQEIIYQDRNCLIACAGGHGRTGTALAILAHLIAGIQNPIEFVRWAYCKEAVETHEQKNYVAKITGIYEEIEIKEDIWWEKKRD